MIYDERVYGEYAVRLVGLALFGRNCVLPPDVDYSALFDFSFRHSIANVVYVALTKLGADVPPEQLRKFRREHSIGIYREAVQTEEEHEIARAFERAGIDFMPLKGCVLKALYPSPDLRSMCDIDILVDNSKLSLINELLCGMGYTCVREGELFGDYEKKPFMRVEIHGRLFDNGAQLYDDYFGTDFRRTRTADGWVHRREFSDDDMYVFLMAHLAKHYFLFGTGIRSIADIKIFLDAKRSTLNFDYVRGEMKKIELDEFACEMEALSECWFGEGEKRDMSESISDYLFISGVYGNKDNAYTKELVQSSKGKGGLRAKKIRFIFRYIFPRRSFMAANYPRVAKAPALLPYYWLRRIHSAVFKGGRKAAMKRIRMVMHANRRGFEAQSLSGKASEKIW